jgi:PAS domain S-box-containing protein
MSMCKVFGYTKRDALIGHEVEMLMPRIYARSHKRFLETAIQKPPDLLTNKERLVFGKHSSGHIFPVWLSIKNVPSFVSGRQFAATFKVEKSGINKNVAYLILDKNKILVDASASAIQMLELDLQRFSRIKARLDISQHLPSLFGQNYYQYVNKAGSQIDYSFPVFEKSVRNSQSKESL